MDDRSAINRAQNSNLGAVVPGFAENAGSLGESLAYRQQTAAVKTAHEERQLRIRCLELSVGVQGDPLQTAQRYYDFIMSGQA